MNNLAIEGFEIIDGVLSINEVSAIINRLESYATGGRSLPTEGGLFAIRQLFKAMPDVQGPILTNGISKLIQEKIGRDYFIVKSIYFDKPPESNWFVSSHQDLTISVKDRHDLPGYQSWTKKDNQYAVQPPISLLEDNVTLRIHLDPADEDKGALLVIPGSHLKGVIEMKSYIKPETAVICRVNAGGVMFMKPLLVHRSKRVTSGRRRRVIHIELSRKELPAPLDWSELQFVPAYP